MGRTTSPREFSIPQHKLSRIDLFRSTNVFSGQRIFRSEGRLWSYQPHQAALYRFSTPQPHPAASPLCVAPPALIASRTAQTCVVGLVLGHSPPSPALRAALPGGRIVGPDRNPSIRWGPSILCQTGPRIWQTFFAEKTEGRGGEDSARRSTAAPASFLMFFVCAPLVCPQFGTISC